jgi:hypothetical protein
MVALTGINLVPISLPSGKGWPAATLTSINFADQIHALNIRRFGQDRARAACFCAGRGTSCSSLLRRIEGHVDRIFDSLKPDETNPIARLLRHVLDIPAVAEA